MLSFRYSTRSARSCLPSLLAWLTLVLAAPVPAPVLLGVGYLSRSGGEDSAPEDAPPVEDETPQDDDVLPEILLKRTRAPGRPEVAAALRCLPRARSASPRVRGGRPGSFGFLADGRSLRIQIRSLTC
jgi:hypothetical protein